MRLIVIITAVLFTLFGNAQVVSGPGSQLVFKQISHPFMPEITSQYFYFTEDGLVWFSTAEGLTSFDGSEVVYYSDQQVSNQFTLNRIHVMAEDKQHNMYIGAVKNFSYFNRKEKTFTPITYTSTDTSESPGFTVNAIFIDGSGMVYIGTGWKGLYIYNPFDKKFSHLNLDPAKKNSWTNQRLNSVISFAAHATDTTKLWVGTAHGIYLFDKKDRKFTRNFEITNPGSYKYGAAVPEHYDVQRMDVVNDSIIWFNSHTGGFCRYNSKSGKVKVFLHDAIQKGDHWVGYVIRNFAKVGNSKYLLSIDDPHPGVFDTEAEKLQHIQIFPAPSLFDRTRFSANDKQGNTWVLNKGQLFASIPEAYRLKRIRLQDKPFPDLRYNNTYDVVFDRETQTFIAGGRTVDGLRVYDTNFNEKTILPTPLFTNYFLRDNAIADHITKDGAGRYWTTGLQTYVLQPGQGRFDYVEKYFPSLAWLQKKEFSDILNTRNGDIALRQFSNGNMFIIDHKTQHVDTFKIPAFTPAATYEFNSFSADYDSSRNLLYSSNSLGLARLNLSTGKVDTISGYKLLKEISQTFSHFKFKLDDKGRIWIMIEAYGIRILNPDDFSVIDSIRFGEKGLLRNNCTDIKYGGKNKMLLKSGSSIIIYDYAEKRSVFFDYNNGYSYQVPKTFLYCNNYLFIGQTGELEYYNMSNFADFNLRPRPLVNTILADTIQVFTRSAESESKAILLKANQNNLSFSFSATEFFFPERIEYAYQLTGVDDHWQYTGSLNTKVNYTRLSPGTYKFRLMAQAEGGNWNSEPVEYTIVIVPAWWQTNLFKILSVLGVVGLLVYLYRRRIVLIRNKEQQRARHEKELLELEAKALRAQMNPHFVFNSLNSIKSLINKSENDKAASYLTTFSKLIRTLFQNSDKREVSLFEELETCKLYAQLEKMRFGEKVNFVFDIADSIDLKDIKIPALIIQPFIENAIWHGIMPKESGGMVTISVVQKDNVIQCIIDDDGIGRELSRKYKADYEATHQSKGIGLTQSRLELSKLLNEREENISILDKAGENGQAAGTKVIITLKLNNQ